MSSQAQAIGSAGASVTKTLQSFGFRAMNPLTLLSGMTGGFAQIVQILFSWIYFLSEIGILAGALVFLFGAIGHHGRIKGTGVRVIGFSVFGFVLAVILPGVVLALNSQLHG